MISKLLFTVLFLYPFSMCAMEEQLTEQESSCIEWFVHNTQARLKAFKQLNSEHKKVLEQRIPFDQEPQKISAALTAYTNQFYQELKAEQFPYKPELLTHSLIKFKKGIQNHQQPFDRITARKYVFSQLLTEQERATFNKKSYRNNPQATYQTIEKIGRLYAEKLAEIGVIENTSEAKKQEADNYIKIQSDTFSNVYN